MTDDETERPPRGLAAEKAGATVVRRPALWPSHVVIMDQVHPSVDKQGKSRREALLSTSQLDVGLPPSARSRWPPLCCCG
jgi:hypothetical protein